MLEHSVVPTLKQETGRAGRRCFTPRTLVIRTWSSCWWHTVLTSMQCMYTHALQFCLPAVHDAHFIRTVSVCHRLYFCISVGFEEHLTGQVVEFNVAEPHSWLAWSEGRQPLHFVRWTTCTAPLNWLCPCYGTIEIVKVIIIIIFLPCSIYPEG